MSGADRTEQIENMMRVFNEDLDDPDVTPEKFDRILDMRPDAEMPMVADILDSAAEQGKVPNVDYTERLADQMMTDGDLGGVSKRSVVEGLSAEQQADNNNFRSQAMQAVRTDDIREIVDLYNKLAKLADDSLKSPSRTSIPENVKEPMMLLSTTMRDRVFDIAAEDGKAGIQQYQDAVQGIQEDEFRTRIVGQAQTAKRMVDSNGTEFESAKSALLDEEQTLGEHQQTLRAIRQGEFDISLDQFRELLDSAEQWQQEFLNPEQAV